MKQKMSFLQQKEREAMLQRHQAIISVVSALRNYRKVTREILRRHREGQCDDLQWERFESDIDMIESGDYLL